MGRTIDPPRAQLDKLLTPLTAGERRVVDLFDEKLPAEWEIYVQPHLNGLRPDVVLLHPRVGIAVFEVKDWDLGAMDYFANPGVAGSPMLMARERGGRVFSRESDNPINKILLYKDELFDLYCPRLDSRAGFAVITAGLIFPCSQRSEVERVFSPFRNRHEGVREHPEYYPIAGMDDLDAGNLTAIFPESRRQSSHVMSSAIADDLRGWLKEPCFSQEQRTPLELDARQRELVTTRTDTGYRRIKGPAGAGKSVVLAARAASLAAAGKNILVVTYNITLLNYLRDLAVRHTVSRAVIRRQIDFLNFHSWCKRVCLASGHGDEYRGLWATSSGVDDERRDSVINAELPLLMQRLYRDAGDGKLPRYDAILVDEGQDFMPAWWQALRLALEEGGEIVLAADKTQNIYATAAAWTEDTMANAGFRGPWAELKVSYRLPPVVIPLVARFARQFMADQEIDIPQVEDSANQLEFSELFPVDLRWCQLVDPSRGSEVCVAELLRMMQRLRSDTAVADITFLSDRETGRGVTGQLEDKGVRVLHTFAQETRIARRQKRAFFQGAAQVKATTLHSFKGWEARHLVVFVGRVGRSEDRALLYTAMTRIRRHVAGSALTVVSCCPELVDYGQAWPEFVEQ